MSSAGEAESDKVVDTRDDSVLPDSFEGSLIAAAKAAARIINSGAGTRVLVEVIVPELEIKADDGDQQREWDMCGMFVAALTQLTGQGAGVRAIFPDAGAAAMLKNAWVDASFQIGSLNDRKPVGDEDTLAVLCVPDHQMVDTVRRIASNLATEEVVRPMVMFNPRLFSGDVGIGLNVRRTRQELLDTFVTAYSLRPLPQVDGTLFREYPGRWKVFLPDTEVEGRYRLVEETDTRPSADRLDQIYLRELGGGETGDMPAAASNTLGVLASLNRFMRSLTQ
eukprot:jgi/Mesvir1/23570/Mv18266-RA.1